MLEWKSDKSKDAGLHDLIGFSGDIEVGSVWPVEGDQFYWELNLVNGQPPRYGYCDTEPEAKAAAESAFREWMERAGVTVIPDGWKLVPEEPTPEIIDGWLIACCSSWLSANVAREMYLLLMGAIRERGPQPDHFRDAAKMVDSQVLKHHETFDADMAEVRDVLRDTPKNPEVEG